MLISAVEITDEEKKNELILFARSVGAKAIYSITCKGMAIECYDNQMYKKINKKIKDLIKQQEKKKE